MSTLWTRIWALCPHLRLRACVVVSTRIFCILLTVHLIMVVLFAFSCHKVTIRNLQIEKWFLFKLYDTFDWAFKCRALASWNIFLNKYLYNQTVNLKKLKNKKKLAILYCYYISHTGQPFNTTDTDVSESPLHTWHNTPSHSSRDLQLQASQGR